MRRRDLIAFLGGAAIVCPLSANAQQPAMPRVGILSDESRLLGAKSFQPFAQALRDLGYIEGKNIVFESRSGEGKNEILPGLAAELVQLKPDVILAIGTPATRAAKSAQTIPIVFTRIGDPIGLGLISTLARPGGNITGLTILTNDTQGKRLQLLITVVPDAKRIGVLWDPSFPPAAAEFNEIEGAARSLNLELVPAEVRGAADFEPALRAMVEQRAAALIVVPGIIFSEHAQRLVDLAAKARLPAVYVRREHVEVGGLMAYATNYPAMYRRAAAFVDKILKGTKPADIPVEQPTKLELVINLKTAKALGIIIPPLVLALADEVIE
jgi:putative ABC transport system substrate-binding protein